MRSDCFNFNSDCRHDLWVLRIECVQEYRKKFVLDEAGIGKYEYKSYITILLTDYIKCDKRPEVFSYSNTWTLTQSTDKVNHPHSLGWDEMGGHGIRGRDCKRVNPGIRGSPASDYRLQRIYRKISGTGQIEAKYPQP